MGIPSLPVLTILPPPGPSLSLPSRSASFLRLLLTPSPALPSSSKTQTETPTPTPVDSPHQTCTRRLNQCLNRPGPAAQETDVLGELSHGPNRTDSRKTGSIRAILRARRPRSRRPVSIWLSFGLNTKAVTHRLGCRAGPLIVPRPWGVALESPQFRFLSPTPMTSVAYQ